MDKALQLGAPVRLALYGSLMITSPAVATDEPPAPVAAINSAQSIAPSLTGPASDILSLEEERNRRLTLPVLVDGVGPFRFMIDTGSQATAITHDINRRLNLRPVGRANLIGMASQRTVDMVAIGRIEFGKHFIEDLRAPLLERTHVGADGIIGLDSLQGFRVLLDFRQQTIALEDMTNQRAKRGGFEIIVRARSKYGQLLITDALIEGIRATVIIDTGAEASLANPTLRELIRSKRAEQVTTTDVNGVDLIGHVTIVDTLKIEGLSLNQVPLTFADSPVFNVLGLDDTPAVSLGMQHLRLFDRVAIDFRNRRIMFDLPRDMNRARRDAQRMAR
jgi:predicted aspartyl protease